MPRKRGIVVVAPLPIAVALTPVTPHRPQNERQPSRVIAKAFGTSFGPLYTLWERLQVSHCGQYSVERMLALEEYGQRVSPIRVAAVCVFTPLPALLLVVLAGYMPLRPADEGPDANYVFWMRHVLILGFAVLSGLMQAKAWLAELHLTMKTIIGTAFGVAVVTTAIAFLVARFWVFPLPFMNVVQTPGLVLISTIAARIVLGGTALQNVPDAEFRVNRFFMLIVAQGSLATIYPAYQALFLAMPPVVQPYLMALLTLVNIAMKNALAACGAHLEDRLPEVIVFTIDVFSSLYSALCMRSTNSLKMVAIAVSLNTFDMMLALHGMNRRSRVALANRADQQLQARRQKQSDKELGVKSKEPQQDSLGSLFKATLQLLQMPGQLDPAELRQICLLSCAEHKVSDANKALLEALAARCVYNNERRPTEIRSMAQRKSRYSSTAVSGPDLSFAVAIKPPSHFMQRLRAAVLLIPEAGKRFSVQIGTRLGNSLGFRMDSKDRLSQRQVDTEGDDQSDTDSFENDTTPNGVGELTSTPSRRSSAQTRSSTPPSTSLVELFTRRISGQTGSGSGQVEPFSRRPSTQGGSGRRISTQMGAGSSRRVSVQMPGGSSRKVSALPESPSVRRLAAQHLGSSRRLAELTAASTKLATTLKLRSILMPGKPVITDVLKETRKQNTVAVNQTLQLLFNNEYLGLIAYAQCITPMIYMGYMIVMQEMPNRVFYLNGQDLTHPEGLAQRFTVIAMFVGLQMGILIGLHVFVATRFGVSTLYQVAFVLETHARLVQGKIATWLLFAVSFMLEHYGADFSFRFDWVENAQHDD